MTSSEKVAILENEKKFWEQIKEKENIIAKYESKEETSIQKKKGSIK